MKARVFVVAIVFIAVGLAVFAHLRALSGTAVEEGHHARRVGRAQDRAANILIGASRDPAIAHEPRSRAVPSL